MNGMIPKMFALAAISVSSLLLVFLLLAAVIRFLKGGRTGSFAGLCAAGLIYAVGDILELNGPDLTTTLLAIRGEYIGIAFISPFLLLVARDFADDGRFRVPTPLLFIIPAITLALVFTMHLHNLYYIDPYITSAYGLTIIHFGRGPGYWLQSGYNTLAIAYGVYTFARYAASGPFAKRRQAVYMLIGCILPWIGNILYLAGIIPLGIDPAPLFLSAAAGFFAVGFFRYHLFDLRPVARETVFEQMRDAVLVTDENGTVVDHNIAAGKIFPTLSKRKETLSVRDLTPSSPSFLEAMADKKNDTVVSLPLSGEERRYALHHSVLSDRTGPLVGMAHVFMDVTERVFLEERLTELASTDELTGLANRRSFYERARVELERAQRYGRPFGVAILDLDDFKCINDSCGHAAGDEALRLTARLCLEALRAADIMGRYGGDEFVFAFPECDEQRAQEAAERLAHIVRSAVFPFGSENIRLSASVGAVGASAPPIPDLEELLKAADERMYERKKRGGSPPDTGV
jgi:diguanylate cyclase (GGDEF)-like protein